MKEIRVERSKRISFVAQNDSVSKQLKSIGKKGVVVTRGQTITARRPGRRDASCRNVYAYTFMGTKVGSYTANEV